MYSMKGGKEKKKEGRGVGWKCAVSKERKEGGSVRTTETLYASRELAGQNLCRSLGFSRVVNEGCSFHPSQCMELPF